jgi:hypothetical protein
MLKKNVQIGQAIGRKEMKNVKGGIDPCLPRFVRVCTYAYNNANDCCNWALSRGTSDFTFNASNCQCCAITTIEPDYGCYNGGGGYAIP